MQTAGAREFRVIAVNTVKPTVNQKNVNCLYCHVTEPPPSSWNDQVKPQRHNKAVCLASSCLVVDDADKQVTKHKGARPATNTTACPRAPEECDRQSIVLEQHLAAPRSV